MDESTAFLNAVLNYVLCVKPPPGYVGLVPEERSLLLIKALYGLKQVSRIWNHTLDNFLKKTFGMTPCEADGFVYTRYDKYGLELGITNYFYDILIKSKSDSVRERAKIVLISRIKMKDLGLEKWFLGINITHSVEGIHMPQESYVDKLVDRSKLGDAKPTSVPLTAGEGFTRTHVLFYHTRVSGYSLHSFAGAS